MLNILVGLGFILKWGGIIAGVPLFAAWVLRYCKSSWIDEKEKFSDTFENCFYFWLIVLFFLFILWLLGGFITLLSHPIWN